MRYLEDSPLLQQAFKPFETAYQNQKKLGVEEQEVNLCCEVIVFMNLPILRKLPAYSPISFFLNLLTADTGEGLPLPNRGWESIKRLFMPGRLSVC